MEEKKNVSLPPVFAERMKKLLGTEYQAFEESYQDPRTYGLRVNTSKISCEAFEEIVPFPVKKIPWIPNGYFYDEEVRPSHCPMYQAGLYYLQDPSAMTPASRLPIKPGETVLDLCAAPGGKATQAGSALKGEGLLIANDISPTRARALLRNIELFGISNVFVTNDQPAKLVNFFPEFFDKILLDAPCSGEGMFRKEEALLHDWTPEKSMELSRIQKELLSQCMDMLKPGGYLLYSTCTFSPDEDESVIASILRERNDISIVEMEGYEGFSAGIPSYGDNRKEMKHCVRIFPHKMKGEGHFLALLYKEGIASSYLPKAKGNLDKNSRKYLEEFFREIGLSSIGGHPIDENRIEIRGEKVYYLPPVGGNFRGITFLRNGIYLGDLKKNRFEPSEPFALALYKGDASSVISLSVTDDRLTRYLKGETLLIEPGESTKTKGWHLLCVEGYPLGFGKLVNGTLKNKYPAGWRIN